MDINKTYNGDIALRKSLRQSIALYPKTGYYISKDGTNEFLGSAKILSSSNEILFVNYQKTEIPSNSVIKDGKLKLFISNISGTANNITLNVYAAAGTIDADTTWNNVVSGGSLRGSLLGTTTLTSANSDDYALIDIESTNNYLSDYVYGSSSAYGLIIEIIPLGGTSNVRVVGLYCWDHIVGEQQNPIIEVDYSYIPNAAPYAVKVNAAITEDAYVSEKHYNVNYNEESIIVERYGVGGNTKYGLFKFDFSDIPLGSDILEVLIYIPRNQDDKNREHREIIRRIYSNREM